MLKETRRCSGTARAAHARLRGGYGPGSHIGMDRVSVRDLENNLGAYLRRVEGGARFVVTDRGRPVAELGPVRPEEVSPEEGLQRMAESGDVIPPAGKGFSRFRPITIEDAPLSSTLLDERKERF